jgi:hypothetical protein
MANEKPALRRGFIVAKGKSTEETLKVLKTQVTEKLLPQFANISEIGEGGLLIDMLGPLMACGCGCGCSGGDGGGGGGGQG